MKTTLKQRARELTRSGMELGILLVAIGLFSPVQAQFPPEGAEELAGSGPRVEEMGEPPMDGPEIVGRGEFRREGPRRKERFSRRSGEGKNQRFGPGSEGENRVGRMGNFLNFVNTLHGSVKDPHQAIGLAVLSIKDAYRKQGKPEGAVESLEKILSSAKDQQVRNIVLFNMRQIFEETRNTERVLKLNRQIIDENMAAIDKK